MTLKFDDEVVALFWFTSGRRKMEIMPGLNSPKVDVAKKLSGRIHKSLFSINCVTGLYKVYLARVCGRIHRSPFWKKNVAFP